MTDAVETNSEKTDLVAAPEEANLKEAEAFATAQTVQRNLRVRPR
jgi:hypothetical protein